MIDGYQEVLRTRYTLRAERRLEQKKLSSRILRLHHPTNIITKRMLCITAMWPAGRGLSDSQTDATRETGRAQKTKQQRAHTRVHPRHHQLREIEINLARTWNLPLCRTFSKSLLKSVSIGKASSAKQGRKTASMCEPVPFADGASRARTLPSKQD